MARPKGSKTARPKAAPPAVPDEVRCQHTDASGNRCPNAIAQPNGALCKGHILATAKDVMSEKEAKGLTEFLTTPTDSPGEAVLREELERLRAQNAVLASQMKRLLEDGGPARVKAAPGEDPEAAADRLARQMPGKLHEEPARAPRPRRQMDVPAEAQATTAALGLLRKAQEEAYAERDARRRDRRRRGLPPDEGRIPIEMRVEIPKNLDPAAMVDRDGNSLVPPGWVGRWLRDPDAVDDPAMKRLSEYRIQFHKQVWNAKPVMEKVYDDQDRPTGQIRAKKGLPGLAYMMPNEKYAQRIIHHSPQGTFDSVLDGELGRLDNLAEEESSRYGKRGGVGTFFADRESGEDPEGARAFFSD